MRFYEFTDDPVVDMLDLMVSDDERKHLLSLSESSKELYDEFTSFIGNYLTDFNDLEEGKQYYVFSLSLIPSIEVIKLAYEEEPIKFIGKVEHWLRFKSRKRTYSIPSEVADEKLNMAFSAVVFSEADSANQFITALLLQFDGRYTIRRTIM